jgi:uncharacterized protein (DUF302 family)
MADRYDRHVLGGKETMSGRLSDGREEQDMGVEPFSYGMRVKTGLDYDDAVAAIREALAQQGFGILTEIDVRKTLKEKRGVDFRRYLILGPCNPDFAHQALEAELEIGLLLPCNVIVYEDDGGSVVAAMDPAGVMRGLTHNPGLESVAVEVRQRLLAALRALADR